MQARKIRTLVALALTAELIAAVFWLIVPKFNSGPPGGAYHFRAHQRMSALSDWKQNPTPATKATWEAELVKLRNHNLVTREIPLGASLILVNGALVYLLWKYRGPSRTAQ